MQIAFLCHPGYGGSGIVATELGIQLASKGYKIHFISHEKPVRLDELLPGVFFHRVDPGGYPLFRYKPYEMALSCKIYELVKKFNISIIHSHYVIPHAFAAYMAREMLRNERRKPVIITTLHGTDITLVGQNPSYKTGVEFGINQSDITTCVSESLKKDTLNFFDIQRDIEVIPNFVNQNIDALNLHTAASKPLNSISLKSTPIITHTSNFRKVKRIQDIIAIFHLVMVAFPSVKLILVGEGPEKEKAQQQVRDLSLEKSVCFYGYMDNVHKVLAQSDIFLLPSETESFGLAALEAMNEHNAIVSSNTGGIPELNIEGETGFLHEVGDIKGMASSIIKLLKDPPLMKTLQENAFRVAQRFEAKRIIPKYENIYNRLS